MGPKTHLVVSHPPTKTSIHNQGPQLVTTQMDSNVGKSSNSNLPDPQVGKPVIPKEVQFLFLWIFGEAATTFQVKICWNQHPIERTL